MEGKCVFFRSMSNEKKDAAIVKAQFFLNVESTTVP